MKKLTYGMVGGGLDSLIGDAHRKAMNLDALGEMTAGCFSRNPEKSRQTGSTLGLAPERCYGDFKEMAAAESARPDGIDFVIVVTPNVSHYEVCKAFLEAGIHVSCDKPLCFTVEQAEELKALAEEKDLLFMVTYTYMGYVTSKHIRRYIADGNLGKIRTVMAEYPQGWLAHEGQWGGKQGQWRCDPKQSGDVNCLGDLGTHVENAVATMTGLKIKRLLAKMDAVVPGRILDDNDVILVEYEGGATGCYWTSQIAIGHKNPFKVRIYGEKGTIFWEQEYPERISVFDVDGTERTIYKGATSIAPEAAAYGRLPAGHGEGWLTAMANLYCSFTACLRAKKDGTFTADMIDYPTVDDGIEGVKFIHACLKSSKAGNIWVDM